MVETGFLLSGDSFAWSPKGLLKICELKPGDRLLGIKAGEPSWSVLRLVKRKPGINRMLRITTDGNELLVSKLCEVFTINGVKKASDLSVGEILETFNMPSEIQETIGNMDPIFVESEEGPLNIDGKIAYILGTQIRSPKADGRIIIQGLNPGHAYEVAKLCSEGLKEQFVQHKIYYADGGKKIRVDCNALAEACRDISQDNIPRFIRESNAVVLRHFLSGVLDTMICMSEFESPSTFLITLEKQSEFRRFVISGLRLFGIIPAKTYVFRVSTGDTYVKTYVNPQDLRLLGLRFIRTKDEPRQGFSQKGKAISYCTTRSISQFNGRLFSILEPEMHWSPIIDMTPLHRHSFGELG